LCPEGWGKYSILNSVLCAMYRRVAAFLRFPLCKRCCILYLMSQKLHYDLCVIGGGLHGTSIARDAAGRGLSVLLVEAQDLAGATSSATSKIIHGGVLGLEKHAFIASVNSLKEREILHKNAQHLFHPMACIMPLDKGDEGDVKVGLLWRMKLWLYNKLSERDLFKCARFCVLNGDDKRLASLKNPSLEKEEDDTAIMKPHERLRFLGNITDKDYALRLARKTLTFTACRVDDTRLVICNAIDAASRGAKILTYTSCERLQMQDGCWRVSLCDMRGDDAIDVTSSMVVNATGPWAGEFINKVGVGKSDPDLPQVNLAKDSHIILPRQYEGDHAYALRQNDGAVVYVMPYEEKYTLVGASQEECEENVDPREVRISEDETRYLINAYNAAFEKSIKQSDVVFAFSAAHPASIGCSLGRSSHDYLIYHHKRCDVPLISVYGGKTGCYRILAQNVVDRLMALSGRMVGGWTACEPLVSARFSQDSSEKFRKSGIGYQKGMESYIFMQKRDYPWLPEKLLRRYVYAYGTRMKMIVSGAISLDGLGEHYGDGVYEAELNYLREHEWVLDAGDMLWRRTKLALSVGDEAAQHIEAAFLSAAEDAEEEGTVLCA